MALRRLTVAVGVLQTLDSDWVVRYRPGRPTYGKITLTGSQGSGSALFEWYRHVLDGFACVSAGNRPKGGARFVLSRPPVPKA